MRFNSNSISSRRSCSISFHGRRAFSSLSSWPTSASSNRRDGTSRSDHHTDKPS
jgi:hypothetical protein